MLWLLLLPPSPLHRCLLLPRPASASFWCPSFFLSLLCFSLSFGFTKMFVVFSFVTALVDFIRVFIIVKRIIYRFSYCYIYIWSEQFFQTVFAEHFADPLLNTRRPSVRFVYFAVFIRAPRRCQAISEVDKEKTSSAATVHAGSSDKEPKAVHNRN